MKEYQVYIREWNEGIVTVMAENEDEAIEFAENCDDNSITWSNGAREVEEVIETP